MFVYIDESGDHRHYILAAVASRSRDVFGAIVRKFRAEVRKSSSLSDRDKKNINNDPKEHSLYRDHPRMLVKFIDLIALDHEKRNKPPRENVHMYATCYKKKGIEVASFPEERMLQVYETMFMQIINAFVEFNKGDNLEIIFDHFNKAKVMKPRLIEAISKAYPDLIFTLDYAAGFERDQHLGLYVADIAAGTCRRYAGKDIPNYFHNIKDLFIGDIGDMEI